MKSIRRFLAVLLTLVMLTPAVSLSESGAQEIPEEEGVLQEEGIPEDWEAAEIEEEYWALSMWMAESEGTVKLFDAEDNPLDLDDEMRFSGGTVLETDEESLAVVDMDRKRLAIMDEISRAGFEKADNGGRISITLQSGAMYFRVGQPLEEEESFDVVMDDIRLAIRGTCGMVQQSEEGLSIILASGHAVITREPEAGVVPGDGQDEENAAEPGEEPPEDPGEEPEEIMIEAGEIVSVSKEETDGGIRFEKKKLAEDEVPVFLTEALRKDPAQLEKVYAETGWQPEKLFGDDIPVWMLPAEELDGIPEELVGRTFGCGGWYRLSECFSFPEKNKMTVAVVDPDSGETASEKEYTITSVKQYTPHFYELRCESGSRVLEKKLILPGITEEEIAQLKACLKLEFMKEQWEMIRSKNQYVLYADTVSGLFFDDITAAGVSRAKPFADYQPSGYAVMLWGQRNAGLPDSLIGKTLARKIGDTGYEETWTFISKNTVKLYTPFHIYSWGDSNVWHADWRELTLPVSVGYISDHFLMIDAFSGGDDERHFSLELMIPGMSERETVFCRECIASREGGIIQPSSVPIDGNSYCTYEYPYEILRIIPLEVR